MMSNCLLTALLCGLVSLRSQGRVTQQTYILGDGPVPSRSPNGDRSAIPIFLPSRNPGEEIRYPSESQRGRVPKRIPQPNIVGNITRHLCFQRKYMHLRACYYALHPEYQSKLDFYTRTYMCKERRLKEERALRAQQSTQNRAFPLLVQLQTTRQRSRKKRAATFNACSTEAIRLEIVEAEDKHGKTVELLADINNQLFQTFYVKKCNTAPSVPIHGLSCVKVQAVVETAVYDDNGDDDVTNDPVVMAEVKIPVDCALHHNM